MKLVEIYSRRPAKETVSIDLIDPRSDAKIPHRVNIEFKYHLTPAEYEEGYKSAEAGVELDDSRVLPFQFRGQHYTSLAPVTAFIDYEDEFKKNWDEEIEFAAEDDKDSQKKLEQEYLDFLFQKMCEDLDIRS